MQDRTDSSVAVVTGGSRGIGLEIAKHLNNASYQVIVLSRTQPQPKLDLLHIPCDLRDPDSIRSAFSEIQQRFGRLDVLINNAATLHSQYLMILPDQSIEKMIETNLTGTVISTREAVRLMRRNKYGRIVFISSMATVLKPIGDSVYAATKAGLEMMSAVIAKEVISYGVTCNVLSVSAFETEMFRSLREETVGRVVSSLTVPGFVSIEDMTNVIDFFLSKKSAGVTAQIVRLGGVS